MKFGRSVLAEVTREFEHEVPAHRIADQRDAFETFTLEKVAHDGAHIAGEAGVIERRRKSRHLIVAAAAVAHVHANDVGARTPELVRVANHVLRVRRAFQAMHHDRRWPLGAHLRRLPVALAQDLRRDLSVARGRDFDKHRHRRRQIVCTRQEVAEDGLHVTVAQEASWHEGPRFKRSRSNRGN